MEFLFQRLLSNKNQIQNKTTCNPVSKIPVMIFYILNKYVLFFTIQIKPKIILLYHIP